MLKTGIDLSRKSAAKLRNLFDIQALFQFFFQLLFHMILLNIVNEIIVKNLFISGISITFAAEKNK